MRFPQKVVQVAPLLLPPVGDHLAEHGADPCQKLVKIRCGPGAAVLPKDVTRIHMEFAHKLAGGHMGPRFAWPLPLRYLATARTHGVTRLTLSPLSPGLPGNSGVRRSPG